MKPKSHNASQRGYESSFSKTLKNKLRLIALGIVCATAAAIAQPNPLYFNTAINSGLTGVVPVGSTGIWQTSTVSISGTYVPAVRCNPYSGWGTPVTSTAAWICYPHTCTSDPKEHTCVTPQNLDIFYKIEFTLPSTICGLDATNPNFYCLSMDFNADNCVYQIFVNNTSVWTTSIAAASTWTSTSYTNANLTHVNLCSGWVAGLNSLIVQVRSGGPNSPNYEGFMAQVNASGTTGNVPCGDLNVGSCCLGNQCGQTQNPLAADYEVPLNTKNFNFSGDYQLSDKVNVGYNCGSSTIGKLNATTQYATNANPVQDVNPASAAVYGNSQYGGDAQTAAGVYGEANNKSSSGTSIGVWGRANGATDNIGGRFYGGKGRRYNIGVSTVGEPSTANPPLYSYTSYYPSASIGIYATGKQGNSVDGGPGGPDWAAWFDGDINIVGNCFWNTGFQFSDKRLKKNIKSLENVSDRILKIGAYSYTFRSDEFKERRLDSAAHIGFIAQELKEVFPELIKEDAKGFYAVDYQGMIPVLLEAIKEQIKINTAQNKQLDEQKQMIDGLMQKLSGTTGLNTLSPAGSGFEMSQNEPNPFTHETVVKYVLPQTISNAFMAVYDLTGKQITTFPINQKGAGSLTITSEKLAAGIYIYSIVADGKVVDSKRMIVAQE